MRFSIVTPAYNAEKHIGEMLDSVRRQTLYDWELRIVDDGSSDNTPHIIAAAATDDPRIKPLYLDDNSGSCFFPRRVAIERSEGDYIVNIDADDIVERDYLYHLDSKIRETGADLVYADMYHFEKDKQPVKIIPKEESVYSETYLGQSIFDRTLDKWEVSGVAATLRSLSLLSLQLYDHEFSLEKYWGGHHDENLTRFDLYLAEKVAFASSKYFYRHNPESITHHTGVGRFDLLEADINLCFFTLKYYGEESDEYKLAHRQLFHHVIEFIRFLNNNPALEGRETATAITKKALKSIDLKAVKDIVSPRYFKLIQMGFHFTKKFLAIYDEKK